MQPTSIAYTLAIAALLIAGGGEARPYHAPRTASGAPDLQGIWTNSAVTFLQRPPIFKNLVPTDAEAAMMEGGFRQMVGDLISTKPIDPNAPAPKVIKEVDNSDFIEMNMQMAVINGQRRTSWIIEPADGRVPFTPAGRKAARETDRDTYDGPEGRPLTERCLIAIGSPEGPPMMNTGFNGHYQIVQTRDHVAIHVEMNHDVRIIRLVDRTHAPQAIRPWMGDSVGWWEGETLVVETTNFNPERADVGSLGGGFAFSAQGKLTERFTRTAKDQILYEFTAEDPVNFKQPWRAEMPMRAAKGPIFEYACHEGNYSLPNALSGARVTEKAPAAGSAP
jgi:hypothetical protein